MTLARCTFCGKEQEDFKGSYLMKNDGTSNYFCSGKCRKNQLKLKRDKRKIRWASAFHEQREKRLKRAKEAEELRKKKKAEKKEVKAKKKSSSKK